MEKVYQVFVSSTFADLYEERKHVSNMLSKAGYLVAGMELFPATDQQQLEYIYRVIDKSDYYVVIVGGRYGSATEDGTSYTEKEYEYAVARKIPVLAFIHSAPDTIQVGKTERDVGKLERLDQFKNRLGSGRIIDHWRDVDQLATNVVIGVGNAINLSPRTGWIRGDQAIDPKLIQEMEKLRLENAKLKQAIGENGFGEITFPENLAGPSDSIGVFAKTRIPATASPYEDRLARVNIGQLFQVLYDSILIEPSEANLARLIGKAIAALDKDHGFQKASDTVIDPSQVRRLRFHFEALGLIQAVGRAEHSEGFSTDYIAWSITDKGRRFAAASLGIKKLPEEEL
ncbi:DUF4062 domain-containing protein [Bradyrhizobium valentinum]|uniref:DUF4062 domain-containing protein n=1 Tax=Bradyrhizobium valentinum TaxID=1518501 RepID=A0A0R3LL96_9BRAD|nr:DUF4062 domain-containing protein [Bradyrhizobium valentinum]KRQ94524.1 hypothetical protein CQ10_06495 [Bradyrhizobium valentinum]KRR08450.1 hypothetical protein CP49_31400 [Bradyrhizobium valentinum]